MPNRVFKKLELLGCSPTRITDTINNAISTASETLDNLGWFEVTEIRGQIQEGKFSPYQVGLKTGAQVER